MNYILNGINLKTTFGVDIINGVNVMLALPDRKESLQNDWADENGIDIDLTQPRFSARTFVFNCILSAPDIATLKDQYFALFTLLKISGDYVLINDYLNLSISVFYQKQSNLSSPYQNSDGGLSVKFDLQFGETDTDVNIPNIYLVNENNQFLVP